MLSHFATELSKLPAISQNRGSARICGRIGKIDSGSICGGLRGRIVGEIVGDDRMPDWWEDWWEDRMPDREDCRMPDRGA